jgi:hypothetical protein
LATNKSSYKNTLLVTPAPTHGKITNYLPGVEQTIHKILQCFGHQNHIFLTKLMQAFSPIEKTKCIHKKEGL